MAERQAAGASPPLKIICKNRRATHDFDVTERIEAGVVLTGSEVKSCRGGKAHLNDAYVRIIDSEAFLVSGHIAAYEKAGHFNHDPLRLRKLLLHRREVDKLQVKLQERGYSAVPLSMYFKGGRVKLEIGVGRGKSQFDRRQDLKDRESRREIERVMRHTQRDKRA